MCSCYCVKVNIATARKGEIEAKQRIMDYIKPARGFLRRGKMNNESIIQGIMDLELEMLVVKKNAEIAALKERVRDLEEANSQLAGAAIEKLPYKSDLQAENTLLREALEEIKQAFRASLPEKGVPDEDMEIFILYPMFRAVLPIINKALKEAKDGTETA
jgi:hypothetical protein